MGAGGMDYRTGLAMSDWLIFCIWMVVFTALVTFFHKE